MQHKLNQFLFRVRLTVSNRQPNFRSRFYLINALSTMSKSKSARVAISLILWQLQVQYHYENRIQVRLSCPVTGRRRGCSKRFAVSRVRVKEFAGGGKLRGVQKSSW